MLQFVFETETNTKRAVHEDLVTSVATLLLPSTDSWIIKPLMKVNKKTISEPNNLVKFGCISLPSVHLLC